jgi:hypothetical protein
VRQPSDASDAKLALHNRDQHQIVVGKVGAERSER